MKKKTTLESELLEFFVLGFVLFVVLYGIFATKLMVFQSSFNFLYKDISLSSTGSEKIKAPKIFKSRPSITSIDDSKTPYNYKDDIVNYNTSFYSIVLPYNLSFYTNKKGTNKAVKQLIDAHKQLHRQLLKNKIIETDLQNNTYNQMLSVLTSIQKEQDEINSIIRLKNKMISDEKKVKISFNISNLKLKNAELSVISKDTVDVIFSNSKSENLLPYDEAIIIIDQLNNHIIMLNNKVVGDYYTIILSKGYDIKTFKEPVVTNIIERLEYSLKKISNNK